MCMRDYWTVVLMRSLELPVGAPLLPPPDGWTRWAARTSDFSTHPLFHIESNNDPGLSRLSWSYKSFFCVPDLLRAFKVIRGSCISISYLTTPSIKTIFSLSVKFWWGETELKKRMLKRDRSKIWFWTDSSKFGRKHCGQSLFKKCRLFRDVESLFEIHSVGILGGGRWWPNNFWGKFDREKCKLHFRTPQNANFIVVHIHF